MTRITIDTAWDAIEQDTAAWARVHSVRRAPGGGVDVYTREAFDGPTEADRAASVRDYLARRFPTFTIEIARTGTGRGHSHRVTVR